MGLVVGRLLHADGTPAAEHRLAWRSDDRYDQAHKAKATTDAQGVFHFPLPPGGGWLMVKEPRSVSYDRLATRWLTIPRPGARVVVEVRLDPLCLVEVRAPAAFPKWQVEMRRRGVDRFPDGPTAFARHWGHNHSGKALRRLPPGTYDVAMTVETREGPGWASTTVDLAPGAVTVIDLGPRVVTGLGRLRGQVVGASGKDAPAWLQVVPRDPDLLTLLGAETIFGRYEPWDGFPSEADGSFRGPPLPPGRWEVRAYPLAGDQAMTRADAVVPARGESDPPLRIQLVAGRRITLELPRDDLQLWAHGPPGVRFVERRGRGVHDARIQRERLISGLDLADLDREAEEERRREEEADRRAKERARFSVLGHVPPQASLFVWGRAREEQGLVAWALVAPGAGDARVLLRLDPGATVEGRVATASGEAAGAGLRVRLFLRGLPPQRWDHRPGMDPAGGGGFMTSDPPTSDVPTWTFGSEHGLPTALAEQVELRVGALTREDGTFSLDGPVPPGSYWLEVTGGLRTPLLLQAGGTTSVELKLP